MGAPRRGAPDCYRRASEAGRRIGLTLGVPRTVEAGGCSACGLRDLFFFGIPGDRAAVTVAFHGHPAGDRDVEPDLKRAVRRASIADASMKFCMCTSGERGGLAGDLGALRPVDLLRRITDLLRP